jgi:hypothetical protein
MDKARYFDKDTELSILKKLDDQDEGSARVPGTVSVPKKPDDQDTELSILKELDDQNG